MPGGIGDGLAADQPMHPVDRDMGLVAVDRDRDDAPCLAIGPRDNGACGLLPSARTFAFEYVTVQRPSTSFWRALAGLSGQISAADLPSLIAFARSFGPVAFTRSLSPSVLRCRGAATRLASTI